MHMNDTNRCVRAAIAHLQCWSSCSTAGSSSSSALLLFFQQQLSMPRCARNNKNVSKILVQATAELLLLRGVKYGTWSFCRHCPARCVALLSLAQVQGLSGTFISCAYALNGYVDALASVGQRYRRQRGPAEHLLLLPGRVYAAAANRSGSGLVCNFYRAFVHHKMPC